MYQNFIVHIRPNAKCKEEAEANGKRSQGPNSVTPKFHNFRLSTQETASMNFSNKDMGAKMEEGLGGQTAAAL